MLLRNPDANTESASSTAQGAEAQSPSAQTESQTQQPAQAQEEPTLQQVAQEAFDKASQAESGQQPSESSDVQSLDKTPAKEEQAESKPATETQQENKQNDEQLPFHNHPRWKEVLGERDQFKQKAEAHEQLAKSQQATNEFCQRFNITPEQYQQAFTIMALLNTDPAEARKALEPIWNQLGQYDGSTLPPDLQARVDAQEMTESVAKELATARASQKAVADRSKLSAHQQQQQAEQRITGSVGQWDAAKRLADPDFVPVKNGEADGLWENVNHRLSFLWTQNPPRSEQAAIALCERAYSDAKKMFSARLPKQQPSKVLNSQRSSQTPRKTDPAQAATTGEMIRQTTAEIAAQHGISWSPNGA